jgi:hypothetical protein
MMELVKVISIQTKHLHLHQSTRSRLSHVLNVSSYYILHSIVVLYQRIKTSVTPFLDQTSIYIYI